MLEIGLCTDDNFAMACGVCITSVFESNKDCEIRVHILTEGLSKDSISRFRRTAEKYKQHIEIYKINPSAINELPTTARFKKAIYFRLLFPEILDNTIHKLLYLDCDIIVIDELMPLWNLSINAYACGCAWDQNADDITQHNRIGIYSEYANSGVILMNLNKWREHNLMSKCVHYVHDFPQCCLFPDQDAINVILKEQILFFHPRFNIQEHLFDDISKVSLHKSKWPLIKEALHYPAIIHYTGRYKPWHKECEHPFKHYFLNIKKNSAWSDKPITFLEEGMDRLVYLLKKAIKIIRHIHLI